MKNEATKNDKTIAAHQLAETTCRCNARKREGVPFCLECVALLPEHIQAQLYHGSETIKEDENGPVYKVNDNLALAIITSRHWFDGYNDDQVRAGLALLVGDERLQKWEINFVPNVATRSRPLTIGQRIKAVEILQRFPTEEVEA